MKSPLTIAVVAGNGIGGTEKAAVLFAVELVRRGHRVVFVTPPGPRDRDLEGGNVHKIPPPADARGLAELLEAERVDMIHQHVPGYPGSNPIYEALGILGETRPRLIETNIFGRLEDPAGVPWVDFRGFVSRASAVQAFQRSRRALTNEALRDMTVLFNPLPPLDPAKASGPQRNAMRQELGLRPEEIFIVRLGRKGFKWNRNEVRVFQQARRRNPRLRMLLMEPPEKIWREVDSGQWGEGIILQRECSDFGRLAAIYAAADLMLHMPDWGESYGYTIAEAMQQGMPVIVNSTPWGDNAQVELVENGVTGLVCNSCAGAVDALLRLAGDPELRQRFATAGAERIDSLSNLIRETDLIEEIAGHVVRGDPLVKVAERNRDLLQFNASFAQREKNVWELKAPGLKFSYYRGAGYSAVRTLRGKAAQLKRALQSRR